MAHGQATSRTAKLLSTARPGFPTTSHQVKKVTPRRSARGNEHAADPVGDPLQRRLVPLGIVDQALQVGQHRLAGDGRHRTTRMPLPFRVPPVTMLAGPPVDRSGSPVSIDSSTADHPADHRAVERDAPHRARTLPGRRREGSRGRPTRLSSSAPRTTRAVGGRRDSSECRAVRRPARAPGLDGPAGHQDGHDQRGHHPVQPGREGAPVAEVDVPAAQRDRLHGAKRQRGQRARGR